MAIIGAWWKRLGLASLAAALVPAALLPVRGQPPGAMVPNVAQGGVNLPPVPPRGAWGEVIMSNKDWIVVQNHEGQQFPISAKATGQFLIRWPYAANNLTPDSVVEAVGQDLGNNTLQTDHVDVFEGADRGLVQPTYASLLPNNRLVTTIDPTFFRFMSPFDIGSQNLMHGWAYPSNGSGGNLGFGGQLHVVGSAVASDPIRISVFNTNFANVVPGAANNLSVTQVTTCTDTRYAQKGDVMFLVPTELTATTVVLSQTVLYKKIPLRQFRLP